MALVKKARVKEQSTTTGTGTYSLTGAVAGFQAFSSIGDTNTCHYHATDGTDWEDGIGTYTLSGTTLARTTILESSNAGAAVDWAAGTRTLTVVYPASKAVTTDGAETLTNKVSYNGLPISLGAGSDASSIAIGNAALDSNTTGTGNTAIGASALTANTEGAGNMAIGLSALQSNVTGDFSSAIGYRALVSATGSGNTAIGYDAGGSVTSGSNNTCIGVTADAGAADTNSIAIGYNAVGLGSNTTVIGNSSTTQTKLFGNLTIPGTITSGVAGATNGSLLLNGSTSGTATIVVPVAAGTPTLTLPTVTGTLMLNPMTTGGDVIYGGASGLPTRLANGSAGQVLTSAGTTVAPTWATPSGGAVSLQQLRLYSTTATPVPVTDTTTVSTIYVGPFNGNTVTLLDGSDNLVNHSLAEISLALSGLTSGKPYDVFLYNNAGTLTIELSAAWTNDTTRSDAVALVKGFVVKNADHTRLHVGTIYTTGTTSTTDTAAKRFVWNRYNRQPAFMANATETTNTWVYTTATIRQANANAANQLDYVSGDAGAVIVADVGCVVGGTNSTTGFVGVGVNSTTVNSAQVYGARIGVTAAGADFAVQARASYKGRPGLGRNYLAWLEYVQAAGTVTWSGDGVDGGIVQAGITGTIWN